jgi:hypothetical protein
MFLGSALAFALRKSGRRQAIKVFPTLATELGLSFVAPRYNDAQGMLVGEIDGHRVHVDPDDQQRILVRFKSGIPASAVAIDLRTYEHSLRSPFGMVTLYSNDREFDRFFRTRFASEALAERLAQAKGLAAVVAPFRGAFAQNLKGLSVTSEGVTCNLDFGRPQHIPAEAIRELLPACLALIKLLEATAEAAGASQLRASASPPPAT